jgi:PIN domain nuclease of toxin-antitoxin system
VQVENSQILLDTHVVLWWQWDDRRLKARAREAIATAAVVWVSAASAWEAAIKTAAGRLHVGEPFPLLVRTNQFTELAITLQHADRYAALPPHHADPFDRLLIAQAMTEKATLVTHDAAFKPYDVNVLWT